jgi:hypothetical protein
VASLALAFAFPFETFFPEIIFGKNEKLKKKLKCTFDTLVRKGRRRRKKVCCSKVHPTKFSTRKFSSGLPDFSWQNVPKL